MLRSILKLLLPEGFQKVFTVFSRSDQNRLIIVVLVQIFLGAIELLGLAAIGLLGALTITGVASQQTSGIVKEILEMLNLESKPFQNQVAIVALISVTLFVFRTILSIMITRRIYFFMSFRAAEISHDLFRKLITMPFIRIQGKSSQMHLFSITQGVDRLMVGIVGAFITMISDASILIVVAVGLFIVNPIVTIIMITYFAALGLLLYWILQNRAKIYGSELTNLSIEANQQVLELIATLREVIVKNIQNLYLRRFSEIRLKIGRYSAEVGFLPSISKYVIEIGMVIGVLVISAAQFILTSAVQAIGTLSLFLAAASRIAPAVLRIQQSAIQIRTHFASTLPTLELIQEVTDNNDSLNSRDSRIDYPTFLSEAKFQRVNFSYPDNSSFAIHDVNLRFEPGSFSAFVGVSGSGKTTLVDLLLGIISPTEGEVTISGLSPREAFRIWPGSVAYVPQDTWIIDGTIKDNVALGYNSLEVSDEAVWNALEIADLKEYVLTLPNGLESWVGERGAKLSGGQRQRLGIARAIYSKPQFLVLDEATSSLDGETEEKVTQAILKLKGIVTLVVIAHRLSTIRNSDCIYYVEKGSIVATGNFEKIKKEVADFDYQAQIMGL